MPEAVRRKQDSLVARYAAPLRVFFQRRTKGSQDADDLVQDVFVRLMGHGRLDQIERLDGYVFQIAANVLRDRARRQAVRGGEFPEELPDIEEETAFSPERVLIGKDALERLVAALYELPEKTRMIFTLYHFEGMPQVEIARRLPASVSTIEKHMAKANAHILRRVGPLS